MCSWFEHLAGTLHLLLPAVRNTSTGFVIETLTVYHYAEIIYNNFSATYVVWSTDGLNSTRRQSRYDYYLSKDSPHSTFPTCNTDLF